MSGLASSPAVSGDNDPSATVTTSDSAIVATLIGSADGDGEAVWPSAGGGEGASVRSTEEGFNLWEAEGDRGVGLTPSVTTPSVTAPVQVIRGRTRRHLLPQRALTTVALHGMTDLGALCLSSI